MKVSEKVKDKAFEPIEVTVTIESEEELISLWHNLNVNLRSEVSYWERFSDFVKSNYNLRTTTFWEVINAKIWKLGLEKKILSERSL